VTLGFLQLFQELPFLVSAAGKKEKIIFSTGNTLYLFVKLKLIIHRNAKKLCTF
jgi:hypothetical protein